MIFIFKRHKEELILSLHTSLDNISLKTGIEILSDFNELLFSDQFYKAICFKEKTYKADKNELILAFFIEISMKIKKKIHSEILSFYCLLFELDYFRIHKKTLNFTILFKIWKHLGKLKHQSGAYFLNLYIYFEFVNQETSNKQNNLIYNEACYNLNRNINKILQSFFEFLQKRHFMTFEDYFSFSKKINQYEKHINKNFSIYLEQNFKNDYYKVIYRILLENIFNTQCKFLNNSLSLMEEVNNYEEILEKRFLYSNHLVLKLNLNKQSAKISEANRDFYSYLNQDISKLFPAGLSEVGKEHFFEKVKFSLSHANNNNKNNQYEFQQFDFVVSDSSNNLRKFKYNYKYQCDLLKGIAFIDGTFTLEEPNLIITLQKGEQEYLWNISQHLQPILFLNHSMLQLLYKNNAFIEIPFLKLNNQKGKKEEKIIKTKQFASYLQEIFLNIENTLPKEEIKNDIAILKQFNEQNIDYFCFKFLFPILNHNKNEIYNVYSFSVNSKKEKYSRHQSLNQKRTSLNITSVIVKEEFFDNNSMNSSINTKSSIWFQEGTSHNKTQKENLKEGHSYIIGGFNIVVIILSIILLVIGNNLNNKYEQICFVYKETSVVNRNLLLVVILFLSHAINPNYPQNQFKLYIQQAGFESLYQFSEYQLNFMLESLYLNYHNLKQLIKKENSLFIYDFLEQEIQIINVKIQNDSLEHSYYTKETIDSSLKSTLDKIYIITHESYFSSLIIYPFQVNETFFPTKIYSTSRNIELSVNQKLSYEVTLNYLGFINLFYNFQEETKSQINNRRSSNWRFIEITALVLLFTNWITLGICLWYLRVFKISLNDKMNNLYLFLSNDDKVEYLKEKYKKLSLLSKFFADSPVKIAKQLSRKQTKYLSLKTKENSDIQKDKKEKQNKNLINKHLTYIFILKPFILVIILIFLLFGIFVLIFLLISYRNFSLLGKLGNILETSSITDHLVYLNMGLAQIVQYIALNEQGLSLKLNYIKTDFDESCGILNALLNKLQQISYNDLFFKQTTNGIPWHVDILLVDCETLYDEVENLVFNNIIIKYPEENFKEILKEYCHSIYILGIRGERSLRDEIYYRINMVLLNKANLEENDIPLIDSSVLNSVVAEIIYLYSPVRTFLTEYYFNIELHKKLQLHFIYLLTFLIINILIQILFFVIIHFKILNKVSQSKENMDKVSMIIECN